MGVNRSFFMNLRKISITDDRLSCHVDKYRDMYWIDSRIIDELRLWNNDKGDI